MRLPSHPPPLSPEALRVRVGTAGWSYADWEGMVYPASPHASFDRLEWMARFLDVVEVNSTFYRPARRRDAESWVKRVSVNPRFRFSVKLFRAFTHDPDAEDVGAEKAFKDGIEPLARAGLLAAVLVQFPYSFKNNSGNRGRLARVLTRFGQYPLALEVRHRSWLSADILAFLSARGIALAGIDQPLIGQPVPATLPLTASFFYVRLHGRNAENWFRQGAGRDARYDYLYSAAELAPWIEQVKRTASEKVEGIIITNNHYRGQAAVNAVEVRAALAGRKVRAPSPLLAAFPHLAIAADPLPDPDPATSRLF